MKCQRCESDNLVIISGKCNDQCSVITKEYESTGYVPDYLGIGEGDYIEFKFCRDCGQIQGDWEVS